MPGTGGKGKFYRVNVRDKKDFVTFRNHDIGEKGHIERLVGKRAGGRWATVTWLIDKNEAHVINGVLIGDSPEAKEVLKKLRKKPILVRGDVFKSSPKMGVSKKSN